MHAFIELVYLPSPSLHVPRPSPVTPTLALRTHQANLPAVARGVEAVLGQWGVSHATVQVFTAEPPLAALAPCGPAAPWIREARAEP